MLEVEVVVEVKVLGVVELSFLSRHFCFRVMVAVANGLKLFLDIEI